MAETKAKGGRKTKLTEETRVFIVQAIKAGNLQVVAAKAAGISEATYYLWMQEGEATFEQRREAEAEAGNAYDEEKYLASLTERQRLVLEFFEAVTRARAEAQVGAVSIIRKHMKDDWRAAAWYLERSFPKEYGKRILPPIADDDNSADRNGVSVAELMAHAEAYANDDSDGG